MGRPTSLFSFHLLRFIDAHPEISGTYLWKKPEYSFRKPSWTIIVVSWITCGFYQSDNQSNVSQHLFRSAFHTPMIFLAINSENITRRSTSIPLILLRMNMLGLAGSINFKDHHVIKVHAVTVNSIHILIDRLSWRYIFETFSFQSVFLVLSHFKSRRLTYDLKFLLARCINGKALSKTWSFVHLGGSVTSMAVAT